MIRRAAAGAAVAALLALSIAPAVSPRAARAQSGEPAREPRRSGTAAGWLRISDAARARYAREIRESAERHGVSQDLVEAVIHVESAFNPRAVSPKGARGLMQLMPQTASALGVQDAFDPQQNIDGGVRHLRNLLGRYPGDLARALAAYNAGEGAVDLHGGIPPYLETQRYVRRVLARHMRGRAPAADAGAAGWSRPEGAERAAPREESTARALPATPLIEEARRASRLTLPNVGLVERAEREPIRAMLARLRQQGAQMRALAAQGGRGGAD